LIICFWFEFLDQYMLIYSKIDLRNFKFFYVLSFRADSNFQPKKIF